MEIQQLTLSEIKIKVQNHLNIICHVQIIHNHRHNQNTNVEEKK